MRIKKFIFDKIGITGSSLCIIHCVATLALAFLIPAGTFIFLNESIENVFAFGVLFAGIFSFIPGYRLHKNKKIISFAILGFLFLIVPRIISIELTEFFETGFTVLGGLFLISAHIKNVKCCKRCKNNER